MRYKLLLIIIIFYLFPLQNVFAHVLKTDGTIGSVMHTDPEDDPIAGEPSILFFEITDITHRFQSHNCDCTIEIKEHGENKLSQSLFGETTKDSLTPVIHFVFPNPDAYIVKISGRPRYANAFDLFALTYEIRAGKTVSKKPSTRGPIATALRVHALHAILFGSAIAANFIALYFQKRKKYKRNNKY